MPRSVIKESARIAEYFVNGSLRRRCRTDVLRARASATTAIVRFTPVLPARHPRL
jgi:hypothetical protein